MRNKFFVGFAILVLLVAATPLFAQDGDALVSGLLNPRNMAFDADGNLYIAEAGVGGAQMTAGDDAYGSTSRISMLSPEGDLSVVVSGITSYREGNSLGASAVQVTDNSVWFVIGETSDFTIPFTHALVEVSKENGRVLNFVDLLALELNEDPDGNPNGQSNPTDFAVTDDGTVIIANAGCNCLMSWNEMDGLQVAVVWPHENDNPVPTAVEIGPMGDIYVGFLTGFPFPQEAARIERWSGGELVQTYEGLTAVTGLLVTAEGEIYATEFGVFDQGWGPGRVVKVSDMGVEPVLEGLTAPYGLAQAPDGTIVVATNAIGGSDGQVIVVPTMME